MAIIPYPVDFNAINCSQVSKAKVSDDGVLGGMARSTVNLSEHFSGSANDFNPDPDSVAIRIDSLQLLTISEIPNPRSVKWLSWWMLAIPVALIIVFLIRGSKVK